MRKALAPLALAGLAMLLAAPAAAPAAEGDVSSFYVAHEGALALRLCIVANESGGGQPDVVTFTPDLTGIPVPTGLKVLASGPNFLLVARPLVSGTFEESVGGRTVAYDGGEHD